MKFQSIRFFALFCVLICLPAFYGCPGSNPKITLTVTDCAVDNITVTENTRITTQAGSQWSLNSTITVKCNGQPVNNAEIKVEFWWPDGTYKLTTNANGVARYTKRGQGSKPSNKTFTVTIKGNDGTKPYDFTIP